jgi:hypothetical protein
MPILAIIFKYLTPGMTLFLKALDKAVDDPNVAVLLRSIGRKCLDAFTTDPVYNAKVEVLDGSLATPELSDDERAKLVDQINNAHPFSKPLK